ncbi:TetR/AcrR family transcriptional regulator [Microbacterium sp. CIAB417]|uniref:TetR/AcrR family transcriptional regulator n=1 Tax=Microbacterium sp. CIAB417 TaxID=2860287 RepID=UPI001FAC8D7E|nr:TetR/AcrR family transcriptional regulator [Microbacterium sp. CIAB417]
MSQAEESPSRATAGRPRDRQIDDALLDAAFALLNEHGYAALSLDAVARRAATSRPALYRRWPNRAALALDAIARRLETPAVPDTGCTLCDIAEGFGVFLSALRSIRPDALGGLYGECYPDAELKERYAATIVQPARRAVALMLDRAVDRGDLRADVDRELLLDILGSLVQYRAMFGRAHLTDAEAESAIEMLLRGAAVDYDALLAHSLAEPRPHVDDSGAHVVHLHEG